MLRKKTKHEMEVSFERCKYADWSDPHAWAMIDKSHYVMLCDVPLNSSPSIKWVKYLLYISFSMREYLLFLPLIFILSHLLSPSLHVTFQPNPPLLLYKIMAFSGCESLLKCYELLVIIYLFIIFIKYKLYNI